MQGMFAEYERARILEPTSAGRLHRARLSLLTVGRARYGYRRAAARAGQPAYWEVHEPEAAVVRRAYGSLLGEGLSVRQIAERLREQGSRRARPATGTRAPCGPCCSTPPTAGRPITARPRPPRRSVHETRGTGAGTRPPSTQRRREELIPVPLPALVGAGLEAQASAQLRQNQ